MIELSSLSFQFYDENVHLLRKGLKGAKASVFVDAALGFVALRNTLDHCVLSDSDKTLTQELIPHRRNVPHRKTQLATFARSVQSGTVGRFEAVFDFKGLDPNLIGPVVEPNLMSRFKRLFSLALRMQIIAVSSGNWWKSQNLNPFIREILNPFLTTGYKIYCHLAENQFLREIYDLELIVYYWALGRGNNRLIDTNRLKILIRATDNCDNQLPFNSPKIQQQGHSMALDVAWFDGELVKRHGYVKTVANHIAFLIGTKEKPCRRGNELSVFASMLKFWAMYCAKSWNLDSLLKRDKSAGVLGSFAVSTVLKQKNAVTFKGRDKQRAISLNKQHLSYLTIYENSLWPHTLIGQIILNIHVTDRQTLRSLRHDENVRKQCLDYVKQNVECFPSKMVNHTLPTDLPLKVVYWYSWAPVNDQSKCDIDIARNGLKIAHDGRFQPYKRNHLRPTTSCGIASRPFSLR